MTKLNELTLDAALSGLNKSDFTAVELTEAHLTAIEAGRHLNAFLSETPDKALDMAKASDQRRSKGKVGKLEGIPIAVKDMFCTKGMPTTAGSKILANFVPPYESTVTDKLWRAGAVMLGKVSQDEFAMGSSNTNTPFGAVNNPWRAKDDPRPMVPGGSSGASAAVVAARMALGATGTDTGGSIRQPASYCGIVGMKPTYGRCSRWGIIAYASSLDQAGCFGRSVRDVAHQIEAISGFDPKDSTSVDLPVPNMIGALGGDIRGLKIGIPREYRPESLSAEICAMWDKAIDHLRQLGAEIVDVSLPNTRYALPAYYIIAPAECSSNLARYDGIRYTTRQPGDNLRETYMNSRAEGFGDEVKRRIMVGTYVLSAGYYDAYYVQALKVRRLIAEDFTRAFESCDVLLTATAPSGSFPIGDKEDDPLTMYMNDIFTVTCNLAGLPGLSLPGGLDLRGMPLGLQFFGKPFDEPTVLRAADALETALGFDHLPAFVAGRNT